MGKKLKHLIGYKIRGTRVVPITIKITGLFIILLLLSNFTTNYINLVLNRGVQIKLMNQLLVRDLKDLHTFSNNQYEIFTYNQNREEAVGYISERALKELKGKNSVFLGLSVNGEVLFSASPGKSPEKKDLNDLNMKINELKTSAKNEGSLNFMIGEREFFGVSKYNQKWDAYLVRAEEVSEFYYQTRVVFTRISIIIILITIICGALGIYLVSHILRFVQRMTDQIMEMRKAQKFGLVDLDDAPNDDITLLGMSFNSLSSNIDNLMTIFRKFVTADVVKKAYKEKQIRLEGASKDLTILFSDIKQFTNMTEVLGTDIISLINMHYQQVIKEVHKKEGIVGSLIGDALLAIFGTFDDLAENKSVEALQAAYRIQEVAADLRKKMIDKREDIIKQRGSLTRAEEIVYRAVLIEVGVGIDGGEVFYGNIGSNERMTNTVIGDNVNSSSRLEGLTRIYKVPVICSEYIRNDASEFTDSYYFHELDIVRVKGKNAGKRIFWPVETEILDDALENNLKSYNSALNAYYKGDWRSAERDFAVSRLPAADVFIQRISGKTPPEGWNGIWTMTEK